MLGAYSTPLDLELGSAFFSISPKRISLPVVVFLKTSFLAKYYIRHCIQPLDLVSLVFLNLEFTVFIVRQYAYACRARYCYGKSVYLSVRRYCIKSNVHIVKLFFTVL